MVRRFPRVSIGLPVYNGAEFIGTAIDSLLRQTFRDFELIISDNHSEDETDDICRGYAARDPRVSYERQPMNRGAAWNFNRVFERARGEYFKWAAHDDLYDETFLSKCVEILEKNPQVVWCHCRSDHIDSLGHPLRGPGRGEVSYSAHFSENAISSTREATEPAKRFQAVLLGPNGTLDVFGLVRREVCAATMRFLPYYGAEKVLVGEFALRGRYQEIPETLFHFRVHADASGCLGSAREQIRFINPKARTWLTFPRLQLLAGHIRAVWRARLSWKQRLQCFGALAAYLFQISKWKSVLVRAIRGQGTGGAYAGNETEQVGMTDHLHDVS